MDALMRRRLAVPLIGLSLLMVVPAIAGTWVLWFEFGNTYRALSVAVCVLLLAQLGLAASIGVRPGTGVPWLRIAMIALAFMLACGVAAVRRSL
ncbi:hypothetical protein IRY44_24820 [Micromonospora sp. ANENR4]|uniref:hypothetical protein n=1 Tax=unclassified Micromonospora TaxID=2617518 RepID=UPI00188FE4C3|nr:MULTISPECIES: hypothetical protein [unclassified Micromonospora]MBF5032983.1 hypothetical protein [Micromonospora sp. ANENR4]MBP1781819.1 hypothetical protein [Micromonospora sp. HB375]MDH6466507.1 hypothetical protein [Micromonospora sp. H404/HB375]